MWQSWTDSFLHHALTLNGKNHLYPFNTWMLNSEEGLECLLYSEYSKDQTKKMIPVQVWVFSGLWTVMDEQQMLLKPVFPFFRLVTFLSTFRTTSSRYRWPSSISNAVVYVGCGTLAESQRINVPASLFLLLTWADLKRFSFQVVKKVFLLKGKLFIKVLMFSFFHPGIELWPQQSCLQTWTGLLRRLFVQHFSWQLLQSASHEKWKN